MLRCHRMESIRSQAKALPPYIIAEVSVYLTRLAINCWWTIWRPLGSFESKKIHSNKINNTLNSCIIKNVRISTPLLHYMGCGNLCSSAAIRKQATTRVYKGTDFLVLYLASCISKYHVFFYTHAQEATWSTHGSYITMIELSCSHETRKTPENGKGTINKTQE